jgi:uncharacterized membrane protein
MVLAILILGVGSQPGFAQTSNGTIVGTVTDTSGAAVPKAKVTGASKDLGVERTTVTDSTGSYRLENLAPGTYDVSVEASGFSIFRMANIQVRGSLEVTANANLEVGSISSTITVEATSGQELQTESGSLGAEISQQEISKPRILEQSKRSRF